MTQHLIDTVPKLVTCTRCKAYVFTCQVSGVKTTVDLRPLDVEAYRGAIIAGRLTYDQIDQAGRPHLLQMRTPYSKWPPYDNHKVLAQHACGTRAMNTTAVETSELPPRQARANDSDARALDAMSTVATPVTRRRSKHEWVTKSCERCKVTIGDDWRFCGIKQGDYWVWVQHDYDCEAK